MVPLAEPAARYSLYLSCGLMAEVRRQASEKQVSLSDEVRRMLREQLAAKGCDPAVVGSGEIAQ